MPRTETTALLAVLALAACASVDPRPDYEEARREIRSTTGASVVHDPDQPVLDEQEIEDLLADGLGLEEATRLALLNNRRLQAGFLGLGVARADYVQAGLLANPSVSLAFLFPDTGGRVRWVGDVVMSVSDIWQIPSRQAIAQAGLEQRVLELSRFSGELVAATRTAYLEGVAAREARDLAGQSAELARRSLEGVRRQVAVGAASNLDAGLAEGLHLESQLAYQQTRTAEVDALRSLGALLSLERDLLAVTLTDTLPTPDSSQPDAQALVAASLRVRPDLRAATRAVAAAEGRVALERRRRIPDLDVGVYAERPEDPSSGAFLVGPGATLELPVFDQNQAQVSRAEFELGQRRKEYEALVAETTQDLRAALDRAQVAARSAAFAQDELLPQAERSASLSARAYELGDITLLTLLQAQRSVLAARRADVAARLEAALARVDVERSAGLPLESVPGARRPR